FAQVAVAHHPGVAVVDPDEREAVAVCRRMEGDGVEVRSGAGAIEGQEKVRGRSGKTSDGDLRGGIGAPDGRGEDAEEIRIDSGIGRARRRSRRRRLDDRAVRLAPEL